MGIFDSLTKALSGDGRWAKQQAMTSEPSARWGQRSSYPSDGSLGRKGRPPKAVLQTLKRATPSLPATGPRPEARPYNPVPEGANVPIPTPRPPTQVFPDLVLNRFSPPEPPPVQTTQTGPRLPGPQPAPPASPMDVQNSMATPTGPRLPPQGPPMPQQPGFDAGRFGEQPFDQGRFGEYPQLSPLDLIKLMYGGGAGA